MSKRELSEEEEDPLIKAVAIKEAKFYTEYAEREKQEKAFIESLVEQMRKDMHVPQQTIENLIDQYGQELVDSNDRTKTIKLEVNLLMKTNEGPQAILRHFDYVFNKAVAEAAYMLYSTDKIYEARKEIIVEFRQRVVDAWNKRHPQLPAQLTTPSYGHKGNRDYIMEISVRSSVSPVAK